MPNPSSLNHDEIKQFYENSYYGDAKTPRGISRHNRKLAAKLKVRHGVEVLDVACGTGSWLLAASECGARPAGIDLSETAINICRELLPDGEFHAGPAESLPFEDGRFDLVTCLGSLEHFLDPVSALKEMMRVAKPGARFLILVPNSGFLTRRLGLYSGTQQASVREQVLSLDEWQQLFNTAGLEVTERWKDLHVVSWRWIRSEGWLKLPMRLIQAAVLPVWPLAWQYQVYHLLRPTRDI